MRGLLKLLLREPREEPEQEQEHSVPGQTALGVFHAGQGQPSPAILSSVRPPLVRSANYTVREDAKRIRSRLILKKSDWRSGHKALSCAPAAAQGPDQLHENAGERGTRKASYGCRSRSPLAEKLPLPVSAPTSDCRRLPERIRDVGRNRKLFAETAANT